MNIATLRGFEAFRDSLTGADGRSSRVDLVLSCVDNYEARMTINEARASAEGQLRCAVCRVDTVMTRLSKPCPCRNPQECSMSASR